MKRWIIAAAPGVIVVGFNRLQVLDNQRVGWGVLLHSSAAAGPLVGAATLLAVLLLTHAAIRGLRPWHLALPALPPITAALFDLRGLIEAMRALSHIDAPSTAWSSVVAGLSADTAAPRTLAAYEAFALIIALTFLSVRSHPARSAPVSRSWIAVAALALTGAFFALRRPFEEHEANDSGVSKLALLMLAGSIIAPVFAAITFVRAHREDASSPSTPYREAPEMAAVTHAVDASSVKLISLALLPLIARGIVRAFVHFEAYPLMQWSDVPLVGLVDDARRDAWLTLAWRWDRVIIPLSVALVAVSVARGLDRRALRVWALAAMGLLAGDFARTHALRRIRSDMVARRTPYSYLATPGTSWLQRAHDFTPGPVELWRASGAVEREPNAARRDEWHLGTLVYGDPAMRANVWSAHLRRWRATSRDGVLTLAGQCSPTQSRWFSDRRQEVDISSVYDLDGCHTIFEVASAADRATAVILRVMSASTVRGADGREFNASTFESQAMTLVVVPGSASVTATEIVSAAKALSGRNRVMLGD